jgi:hypothetical protein
LDTTLNEAADDRTVDGAAIDDAYLTADKHQVASGDDRGVGTNGITH